MRYYIPLLLMAYSCNSRPSEKDIQNFLNAEIKEEMKTNPNVSLENIKFYDIHIVSASEKRADSMTLESLEFMKNSYEEDIKRESNQLEFYTTMHDESAGILDEWSTEFIDRSIKTYSKSLEKCQQRSDSINDEISRTRAKLESGQILPKNLWYVTCLSETTREGKTRVDTVNFLLTKELEYYKRPE